MKNIMYKMLNKINFDKLGLAMFGIGVSVIISSIVSMWLLLPGVTMYFVGMYMITHANNLHSYYEYKIKNK
jgi:ACR3 family arsenite efflux pump ArsB